MQRVLLFPGGQYGRVYEYHEYIVQGYLHEHCGVPRERVAPGGPPGATGGPVGSRVFVALVRVAAWSVASVSRSRPRTSWSSLKSLRRKP